MVLFRRAMLVPIRILSLILLAASAAGEAWTPIVVKGVTELGPQHNPDVTGISRDGGSSVLLNGNIIWLFDDTECWSDTQTLLSFVSNTASFSQDPNGNISIVRDFGVVDVGEDSNGKSQYAILADKAVGTGGWIPFGKDELDFNQEKVGVERVAICEFVETAFKHHLTCWTCCTNRFSYRAWN
jgi:hypothetical protein